jgi:HAD superfamily hydrolase (TIGR01509 family)
MYKYIVFDFGGVIMNFGHDAGEGKKTTGIPGDLSRIFNISLDKAEEIWREHKVSLIKGLESPRNFIDKINAHLGLSVDPEIAIKYWEEGYALKRENINWELVELIKQLKSSYKILLLSDAINLNRGKDKWIIELDDLFDQIYRSYETHTQKPDEKAYLNMLEKIPANGSECLFIDDVQANVDGGNSVGIKSLLYTELEKLRKDLEIEKVI